jgi:2-polyprenyl-3-methyl-5-hydroxy-6-metoxy-1,4-benzoquinol methylase
MLSKCGEFIYVTCPACGADDFVPKFNKNSFSYVDCMVCETFYMNPRPPQNILDWFYSESLNYAYWNEFIFPASEKARLEQIFVPRVERLLELCCKYQVSTEAILEVGAGFGTFCSEVKRRNVFTRIVAVEPTPGLAKTCRDRGLEVFELPVEKIELQDNELFDVVASFEVIEHLFSPLDFVGHMSRLLKPGGILMLACPNGLGFDIATLGTFSNTIDHEHLNYFNPKSLSQLLSRCGLEILESFTPGRLDADLVRNKILAGEFDVTKQPFLKKVLIDDWGDLGGAFQDFLTQQGMSSNMWIVARKPPQ